MAAVTRKPYVSSFPAKAMMATTTANTMIACGTLMRPLAIVGSV